MGNSTKITFGREGLLKLYFEGEWIKVLSGTFNTGQPDQCMYCQHCAKAFGTHEEIL